MSTSRGKIVIIGATGLIGQYLVKNLIQSGYELVVLVRSSAKATVLFGNEVQVEYLNPSDSENLSSIINGSKAVVNLSGESIASRWTMKKKELILRSRIDTTELLVQAIKNCSKPPEVFVQASAIGYYSSSSREQVDESGFVGNGFLAQVVMQWEQAAMEVEGRSRLVIIRTGIVLSAKGGFLSKIIMPIKLFIGGWFGDGKQMISWIHINDHVRAIQFLIDNSSSNGIFNLVSPEPISYKYLAKQIGKVLRRPIWLPIPTFIIKLIFGNMANEVILSNQNVIPSRLQTHGFQFNFSRIDMALKDLIGKN